MNLAPMSVKRTSAYKEITKLDLVIACIFKYALELALCLKRDNYAPEQVQDYYPTPGTASTVMFYTGIDPLTMKPVYVATDYHEKQLQRALLQFNRPQNAPLVREALMLLGREDLIGNSKDCLVRPEGQRSFSQPKDKKQSAGARQQKTSGTKQGRAQPSKQQSTKNDVGKKDVKKKNAPQSVRQNERNKNVKPKATGVRNNKNKRK